MAISTSSYFSNSIVGVPQVAGESVDIYAVDSNPKFAIGTKFERQDGSVFRYAAFAGACTAGQVLACVTTDIGFVTATSAIVSTSSTYQVPVEPNGVYPNGIGSRYILINTASTQVALAANTYRGAYLTVGDHKHDGVYVAGQTYRVKGNTVYNNPANGLTRLELYDQLLATIPTSAFITVAGSKYNDLSPADDTVANSLAIPVGIATNVQAAGKFGWVQTKGPVGVWLDTTASGSSAGYVAVLGTGTLGSVLATVGMASSATYPNILLPIIGTVLSASSSGSTAIVDVQLE